MKIAYKKSQLNINLILGLAWLVLFFIGLLTTDKLDWRDYAWIVFSLIYLGLYFYQKNYNYLSIENGVINMNTLFGKKINLSEITQIKTFSGDYILKTDKKELTINTKIIDPNSLVVLNSELEKLNVKRN